MITLGGYWNRIIFLRINFLFMLVNGGLIGFLLFLRCMAKQIDRYLNILSYYINIIDFLKNICLSISI